MLRLIKGGKRQLSVLCLAICLFPFGVLAGEVGRFTQVEGKVDFQKQGKPEFIPVQVDSRAAEKDAIKTAAFSRAQIQFLDASTLMVAPLSHITIESYMYDSQKQERWALCQLSRGLAHLVVKPLDNLKKKEFLIKTNTATMGIRGTDFYILIGPDFTDVLVKSGSVVAIPNPENLPKTSTYPKETPELTNLLKRADIRAAANNRVLINSMEAVRLAAGHKPSPIVLLNEGHFQTLEGLMHIGLPPKLGDGANPGELLENIRQTELLSPASPPPPPLPPDIGPAFPGGGGIASPFS